jgi:hypothetical protein
MIISKKSTKRGIIKRQRRKGKVICMVKKKDKKEDSS